MLLLFVDMLKGKPTPLTVTVKGSSSINSGGSVLSASGKGPMAPVT